MRCQSCELFDSIFWLYKAVSLIIKITRVSDQSPMNQFGNCQSSCSAGARYSVFCQPPASIEWETMANDFHAPDQRLEPCPPSAPLGQFGVIA
jgi:hypothetical protein